MREVHHVALLIGYGASAVNPYLAMETVEDLASAAANITGVTPGKAVKNLIKALGKGVLKIMSKMGISTVSSYCGAQVFEAIGLSQARSSTQYFTGTQTKLGGVGLEVIAAENRARHADAYPADAAARAAPRAWRPAASTSGAARARRTCSTRRRSSGCSTPPATRRYDIFREYTELVDDQADEPDDAARAV